MKIGLRVGIKGFFPIGGGSAEPEKPHEERLQEKGTPIHSQIMEGSFGEEIVQIPYSENKRKYDTDGDDYEHKQVRCDLRENIHAIAPLWEQL